MLSISKKCISLVLIVVMLFSVFAINSSAETVEDDYGIMPCWTAINSIGTSFTISGIVSTSSVVLTSQFDTTLYIKIELQKLESTGYETIETWTTFGNGTVVGLEKTILLNVFEDYRIRVTCIAANEQHITYDYP